MNVSMNGIRSKLAFTYNNMVEHIHCGDKEGMISDIENMRSLIVGLLCTYHPGDPDFTELDIDLFRIREDEEE